MAANAKNAHPGQFYSAYPGRYTSFAGGNLAPNSDTYEKDGVIKTEKSKNKRKILGYIVAALGTAALLYKGIPVLNNKIAAYNAQKFDINTLFSSLSEDTRGIINKNPKIKEFYSSFNSNILKGIKPEQVSADISDELFLKGLSIDYANTVFEPGNDAVKSLASVISKRNAYLQQDAVSQFKDVFNGKNETYFDRAKAFGSTLDKLNNKLKDGKIITSFDEANKLIDDGVGTRAVFKSLTGDEALGALKKAGITDDEILTLKTMWAKDNTTGFNEAQIKLLNKANTALAEAQSQGLVDKLCIALQNNKISMTKLENYAGEDGTAYFSEKQIEQIYKSWKKSADAKAGGTLEIITKLNPDGALAKRLGFSEEYIKELAQKSSKPTGYTACQANFTYKNGAHGEAQFRGSVIQDFAEYEHYPYDIKKGKNTISEKISKLVQDNKTDVADELSEYQELVKSIAKDKKIYGQYNKYFDRIYDYSRKDELGILDIIGKDALSMPKLNIEGLSSHQNELLSRECLESLSKKQIYNFQSAA